MTALKPALPQLVRVAMMAAITLSAMEVCQSASELAVVLNANELEMPEPVLPDVLSEADREAARSANIAAFSAVKSTLETMSLSRSLILMALAGCASMAFLASLRIRWPSGFPRSASARLIGGAAFAAALFRTLDGAQSLVIARRSADAAIKAIEKLPTVDYPTSLLVVVPTVMNIGLTSLIVGLFLLIGHYFRSDRVQTMFIALDGPEPEPDDE